MAKALALFTAGVPAQSRGESAKRWCDLSASHSAWMALGDPVPFMGSIRHSVSPLWDMASQSRVSGLYILRCSIGT
jgi:hypothetical protein